MALDLAWRGIDVIVAEQNHAEQMSGVKCNHVAARTMEIFRRLGIAGIVRDAGLPANHANDVAFRTSAIGEDFARIQIPCRRDRYIRKDGPDGWWPTPEPPHRINQIYLDPLLADQARQRPNIRYLNGIRIADFNQSESGVVAEAFVADKRFTIEANYMIGCDGPSSMVRREIGAQMTGDAMIGRTQSSYIRAPKLRGMMGAEPAWSTQVINPRRSANMFAVDGRETWLIHNYLRADETDFGAIDSDACIRALLGEGVEYEVLTQENWVGRRMLADRFRDRRVFICGDAAHLWVPFAGYGMNAGIADATNLSWMLAGVLQGWADPDILAAHEAERWPITEQVSHYAMDTAAALMKARGAVPADIETSAEARAMLGHQMLALHTPQFCCGGLNFGSYYDRSPIIAYDGATPPPYTMDTFTPSTVPGCRTPHIWLHDGRSLYDAMGSGYTLLRFDPSVSAESLIAAANRRGVPLSVLDTKTAVPYTEKLVLSRPDQHVAWRGNELPMDTIGLVDRIRGGIAR
jgi:2-polyprenyl-6-methoxyphenol hydroxylase-like FAD-dependent oxidoreductase